MHECCISNILTEGLFVSVYLYLRHVKEYFLTCLGHFGIKMRSTREVEAGVHG